MPGHTPLPPPELPPRPHCRPCPPRGPTLWFWTILVLFLAGLVYLGFLASTGDTFQAEPFSGTGGGLLPGFLLAGLAIAAVVAGICAKHQHHR